MEYFVSRSRNLRIYEEMLTWTQLLFKIRIISFVDDIVRINICCLDRKTMLGVFMLPESGNSWKPLRTKFKSESNIRFGGAVLQSKKTIQVILGKCGEVPTEHLFLSRRILFLVVWLPQFSHVYIFFSDWRSDFNNMSFAKWSQKNLKIEATWR